MAPDSSKRDCRLLEGTRFDFKDVRVRSGYGYEQQDVKDIFREAHAV